jgi:hypothetical protein
MGGVTNKLGGLSVLSPGRLFGRVRPAVTHAAISSVALFSLFSPTLVNPAQAAVGDYAGSLSASLQRSSPVEKIQYYSVNNSNYCWYSTAGRDPAGTRAVMSGTTAWAGAALMAGTAGAAVAGSSCMAPMESASGILALRPMFSAAAPPRPLASQAASLQRRQVSWKAALPFSMALAAALPVSRILSAALRVSMASAASLQHRQVLRAAALRVSAALSAALPVSTDLAAAPQTSTCLPAAGDFTAAGPLRSGDTEALGIAELGPKRLELVC